MALTLRPLTSGALSAHDEREASDRSVDPALTWRSYDTSASLQQVMQAPRVLISVGRQRRRPLNCFLARLRHGWRATPETKSVSAHAEEIGIYAYSYPISISSPHSASEMGVCEVLKRSAPTRRPTTRFANSFLISCGRCGSSTRDAVIA